MKKIMKVIGLIGKSNSGKTSALKYLMIKILEQEGIEVLYTSYRYKSITPENLIKKIRERWITEKQGIGDLTIAVRYKNKIIGVTSYGDSLKSQILPAADTILNKCGGCDIFVCGRHERNDLEVEFEAYKPIETERVSKKPTNDPNKYDACNKRYADELFSIVERSL